MKLKETIENIKLTALNKILDMHRNPSSHDFGRDDDRSLSAVRDNETGLVLDYMQEDIKEARNKEKTRLKAIARAEKMKNATNNGFTQIVCIPTCENHDGKSIAVMLRWICPVCGGPRGKIESFDYIDSSGVKLRADTWSNECGHVEKMRKIRNEAANNGFNNAKKIVDGELVFKNHAFFD